MNVYVVVCVRGVGGAPVSFIKIMLYTSNPQANEDVQQIVKVFPVGAAKWQWLTSNLVQMTSIGSVLIFVTRKANSEELANNLRLKDFTGW